MKQPRRPRGLPQQATWCAQDKEWVLGPGPRKPSIAQPHPSALGSRMQAQTTREENLP